MFGDYPIFGVGPGNYPLHYLDYSQEIGLDPRLEQREAHSLYLEALPRPASWEHRRSWPLWLALRGAGGPAEACPPMRSWRKVSSSRS